MIEKEKKNTERGSNHHLVIDVDAESQEFIAHVEGRLAVAENIENRLSLEEFAVQVRELRMKKYGF